MTADMERMLVPPRLVIAAAMGGLAVFGAVATVLADRGLFGDPLRPSLLLPLLAGAGLAALVVCAFIRRSYVTSLQKTYGGNPPDRGPAAAVVHSFLQYSIIRAALTEGVGLLGIVVYLLTQHAAALIAPALAVLALATQLPVRAQLASYVSAVTGRPWLPEDAR
jgi:hypothetical protein